MCKSFQTCQEENNSLEDVDDPPPKAKRLLKVQRQAKSEKIDNAFQRMSSFQSKVICIYDQLHL